MAERDPLINHADPALAEAYIQAGHDARGPSEKGFRTVRVEGYEFTVGVRRIPDDDRFTERYTWGVAVYQVLTRVDAMAAERLGLLTGRELDRFILKHEDAANALFKPWGGLKPPFHEKHWRVGFDDGAGDPNDPWAAHVITKGRHRISLTLILDWRNGLGLRPGFDKDCNGVGEPVATAPETPEADGGEDV